MTLGNINKQSGISLIEVLVAVLILGGGALGVASMQLSGLKYTAGAQTRTQASLLANDIFDRMRANRELAIGGSLYNTQGFEAASPPAKSCYQAECTPEEMVLFDKASWLNQVESLLPNGQGRIVGRDTPEGQRVVEVTMRWRRVNAVEGGDPNEQFQQLIFRGVL